MKIILASGSPRRKELLQLIVPSFDIIISGADESFEDGLTLEEQAMKLSYQKAKEVFDKTNGDRIVIGSDTIVTKDGKIYGKPTSHEHAKQMIKELLAGDRKHTVMTGLSVLIEKNGIYEEYQICDTAHVYLKPISDNEIESWISTGKAMDKAGAYAIQNEFCAFVEKIEGNYSTIVGLPIHRLYDLMKEYTVFQ